MCDTSLGGFNIDPSAMIIGGMSSKKKPGATPAPRSLQDEVQKILDVMQNTQPQTSAISHAFDTSDAQNLGNIYSQYIGPLSRQLSAEANTSQRTADVGDVQNLGGSAVQAILNADPQQKALRDAANQGVLAQYAQGNQYDPADARKIIQQVRGQQSGQGFGQGSNNDLLTQAMQLGMSGEGLRSQRLQNLQGVMQSNQSQTGDPFMAVLGRPGQSLGFAQGAYGQNAAARPNTDPFANGYAQDLNNTNFNAAWSNLFSQRNQASADKAALYGLIGNVIGAGAGAAAKT